MGNESVSTHNQVIFPGWLKAVAISGALSSGLLFYIAHTAESAADSATAEAAAALNEHADDFNLLASLTIFGTATFTTGIALGRLSTSDSAAWPEELHGPEKND
jgi:hypothetical protein